VINVNKLFPRLSIRIKLVIAFALVALAPLAAVSLIGARETIGQIENSARSTLDHDLELAEAQTARALTSAETHIAFFAEVVLGPLLAAGDRRLAAHESAVRQVRAMIATEPTLYQVKLADADGVYKLIAQGSGEIHPSRGAVEAEYYAWLASTLPKGGRALLPIELSGSGGDAGAPLPAVAIVVPVRDVNGTLLGVVVGEAYASRLFSQVDRASPGFVGVTALVDDEGRFLYHSERKRDWATLLAVRDRVSLHSDFPPGVAAAVLSGVAGSLVTPHGDMVSYRPLALGASSRSELTLYRLVPRWALAAPVRPFVRSVLLAAALVALIVLALALLAAHEFTRPIFLIRDAAWQLARGDPPTHLNVSTNDEFEDLARDFSAVARTVAAHRTQRETLLAERTRLLERTHADLADILEHSADGIIGLDSKGIIRIWNRGAERLLGFTAGQAIGQRADTVVQPSGERAAKEQRLRAREVQRDGAAVNFLTEVRAADGSPVQVTITETMVRAPDDRPLGSSLIVRDNRLQSRLEDQMRRSERLAAISVMAAGLAHEINNPLAVIGNRIECMQRDLRDGRASGSLAGDLHVLQQHVTRLADLTSSLLRFARDDQDEAGVFTLDALGERVVLLLRRTFAARSLTLELKAERPLPGMTGHDKAIETVIVNLLLNAADATPPGGVVTLALRARACDASAEIEVRDTGPGVPAALRSLVFEPFFTTKQEGHGTGLGLTVCRTIVDRHGGTITLDSPPSGGCRFIVTLPLHPVETTWTALAYS
jgi:PAS domain S-box-containing protein